MRVRRPHLPTLVAAAFVAGLARLEFRGAPGGIRKMLVLAVAAIVALLAPGLIFAVSLASAFGTRRVSGIGVDMSVADAVLTLGVLAAIPRIRQLSPNLRRLIGADAVFQLLLLIVVIANPTQRALFEWFHRIFLVTGALVVGAALRTTGTYVSAFRAYVAIATLVAADAVRRAAMSGFAAAYPFGIQKNPAALMIAFALIMLLVAPRALSLPPTVMRGAGAVLLLGLAATRSRGSILALLVVGLVVVIRSGRVHRVFPVVLATGALMTAVVFVTTDAELTLNREDPSAARFHGIGAREETTHIALTVARKHPIAGAGLRYWYDPAVSAENPGAIVEPHSVALVTVAEGGAIGAIAIIVLLVAAVSLLRGPDGDLAELARAGLWLRVIAGLFDIFWVGGTGSLPWILIGVALTPYGVGEAPLLAAESAVGGQ